MASRRRGSRFFVLLMACIVAVDAIPQRRMTEDAHDSETLRQAALPVPAPKPAATVQIISFDWLVRNALAGAIAGTILEV